MVPRQHLLLQELIFSRDIMYHNFRFPNLQNLVISQCLCIIDNIVQIIFVLCMTNLFANKNAWI